MRVLYFSERLTVHDRRFLTAYAMHGYETLYLRLLPATADLTECSLPHGVREVAWASRPTDEPGNYLAPMPVDEHSWADAFARTIAPLQPTFVHAGPLTTCTWIAALAGAAPLVAMSWGSDALGELAEEPWLAERMRIALTSATLVQCDSDSVRERLVTGFGVPDASIVQFPWGIDTARFAPGPQRAGFRQRRGWSKATILLCVRSWEPIYGIDTVLRGFALAVTHNRSLRLVLAGNGSLRPEIERFITDSGITDRVALIGHIANDDLAPYLRDADIYVSASRSDGTSISLLEAMGVGLAALVSNIPGNRSWIREGETGLLFPVDDAETLAEKIALLASQPQTRALLSSRARALCLARSNWRLNTSRFFEVLERAFP